MMDKLRHKLLGILANEYANGQTPLGSFLDVIVTVPTILKKLNITFEEFVIMSEELLNKSEISYFDIEGYNGDSALYALPNGVNAFANKKYLRLAKKRSRENLKFWVQLFLSISSFVIAIIALIVNIKTQKEVDAVKNNQKIEIAK